MVKVRAPEIILICVWPSAIHSSGNQIAFGKDIQLYIRKILADISLYLKLTKLNLWKQSQGTYPNKKMARLKKVHEICQ